MLKNNHHVIHVKSIIKKHRIAVKILTFLGIVLTGLLSNLPVINNEVSATNCPDLKVIFARGSGGERYTNNDYIAFKTSMEEKLNTSDLTYEIDDLDYPAISIDASDGHLSTLINAFIGGGESYDFGDSVHAGTRELLRVINDNTCKNTKYALAGYSQGAVVLLDGLKKISPEKIIYTATFGDPKLYLPEGAGPLPKACSGKGLSDYRIYVPDCKAYKGIIGARKPYVISGYEGKIGTWCNKYDVLCSSYYSIDSHISYVRDGLYEDASRYIFSRIAKEFNFKNQYTSPHDVAFLIDSTDSMNYHISKFKNEALKLAEKTLNAGGRVALYDYRDIKDKYTPVERCNFETCDFETFQNKLNTIWTGGGGDAPESLLSASFHVMRQLNWKLGSTKSLVIMTDSNYHSPDLDGTNFYDVVKLSKQIDPVNFYIVTTEDYKEAYQSLADETGGAVASTVDDFNLLTDEILERYDSLPRVEEDSESDDTVPSLEITNVEELSASEVRISFKTDGIQTIVIVNDKVMGLIEGNSVTIGELNRTRENTISLVPLSSNRRGETVSVELGSNLKSNDVFISVPKAPNTGMKKSRKNKHKKSCNSIFSVVY